MNQKNKEADQLISAETAIGYLLRGGVILGGGLICVGWGIKIATGVGTPPIQGGQAPDIFTLLAQGQELPVNRATPIHWFQVLDWIKTGHPNGWLVLGLVVLIVLPMLRVALAGCIFLLQKDYLFMFFCLLVLLNLFFGILSHSIL